MTSHDLASITRQTLHSGDGPQPDFGLPLCHRQGPHDLRRLLRAVLQRGGRAPHSFSFQVNCQPFCPSDLWQLSSCNAAKMFKFNCNGNELPGQEEDTASTHTICESIQVDMKRERVARPCTAFQVKRVNKDGWDTQNITPPRHPPPDRPAWTESNDIIR
jgi:hypothetical protein